MNCPRCNTELPDTATYCVQCGAPSHPASFSYLPEGTPPWPTSAPKNFSYMQETNVQPASSTYGASSTAQGNQLPTPTSFQSITLTGLGISLKYPSDWQKSGPTTTQTNDLEVRLVPSQQLGMEFRIIRFSTSDSTSIANPNAANQASLQAFSQFQGVTNLTPTTSAQPTIGGVQWNEQDATFTGPNNVQYDFVTVAVQHNKTYYEIFFYSPNSYFKEAVQKYFQPMLNSYKFLS